MSLRVDVSKEEAIAALRAAAWTEHQEKVYEPAIVMDGEQLYRDVTPAEQKIVHTFVGSVGADWNLASAEGFVQEAELVFWGFAIFGHHLRVVSAERSIAFDVEAPIEVRAMWQREALKATGARLKP